jgi:hypothetical protein
MVRGAVARCFELVDGEKGGLQDGARGGAGAQLAEAQASLASTR